MQLSVFQRAPHPPYSPDLAPSDFFLFGYVKEKLGGQSFKTREELYEFVFISGTDAAKWIEYITT